MKNQLLVFTFLILTRLLYSQITDISWQRCFATEDNYSETYCISEFNNGYLIGFLVGAESEGVSNYHGGGDGWFVNMDTLGNVLWERCYGGSGGEIPTKIVPIDESHYYLIMQTTSHDGDVQSNDSDEDFEWVEWVVKIDTSGNILWQHCYGYGSGISPVDAILAPDGGLLLLSRIFYQGEDVSAFYGGNDVWLCKIDTTGAINWETTIGTPGTDNGFKVMLTSRNTYLALCGVNANGGMSGCELNGAEYWTLDVWLVEYDLDGNILGQDCYGGTEWDNAVDFAETDDGFVIVSGTDSNDGDVSGNHGGLRDIWVLVLDKEKQIQWAKCYGGSDKDYPRYVTSTEDGGYMVAGTTHTQNDGDVSGNHGNNDVWVFKTDSIGELQWQHCFGGIGNDRFWGYNVVLKRNDNNFLLAAMGSGISGDVDCDGEGYRGWIFNIKDCTLLAPAPPEMPQGKTLLCVNSDSLSTYTLIPATNAWQYDWVLEPSEAGVITGTGTESLVRWSSTFAGTAWLQARSVNDCGQSAWSDSLVIQTYTCMGVSEYTDVSALTIYPNPASGQLHLMNPSSGHGSFILYDLQGKPMIIRPVKERETIIDVSHFPPGLYLWKVVQGHMVNSGKVVVE